MQAALDEWRDRPHELGGLERRHRPRPGRVRAARGDRSRARGDRRRRLGPRRPRRRLAAGGHARDRAGHRVHVDAVPVHGPAGARGHDRAAGAPRRRDRRADTGAVAFSAVQMSTGEVADLDAILAARAAHDVLTLVDATQAAGWLPLDAERFDFLVAAGYKWLISPRGTAWMTVAPERLDAIRPLQAATGSPATTCTRRTSGRRCGWPTRPAGSTPPPPGSRGSARCPRSSCWSGSGSRRSTSTTSASPTASARASAYRRATPRS